MPISALINKRLQQHNNIYTQQQKEKKPATKTRKVGQDKGFRVKALLASSQPGSVSKGSRAEDMHTKPPRSQNHYAPRPKLMHTTLWLHPLVRAELERIAK